MTSGKMSREDFIEFCSTAMSEDDVKNLGSYCDAFEQLSDAEIIRQVEAECTEDTCTLITQGITSGNLDRTFLVVLLANRAKYRTLAS
jgi:hypothetical protein